MLSGNSVSIPTLLLEDNKTEDQTQYNIHTFTNPSALIAKFNQLKNFGKVICIFTGADNKSNKKSWCPHCVKVKDQIDQVTKGNR